MPNNGTTSYTVGINVGDRHSYLCVLDTETGDVVEEARISTTDPRGLREGLRRRRTRGGEPVALDQ